MTQPHRYPAPASEDRSLLSLIWPLFLTVRVRRLPPRDEVFATGGRAGPATRQQSDRVLRNAGPSGISRTPSRSRR